MKTITDLKPQVKDKSRVNVYLDGSFFCGMDLITVMSAKLKVGTQIDEKRLGEIQLESEKTTAMDKALTYLSGSRKTCKQVADKLKEKGYTAEVIACVTDKLKEYGYIDDLSYAQAYIRTYAHKKGKRLLIKELTAKGISLKDAENAASDIKDESDSATEIAIKYLKNKPVDKSTVQKCYRHLMSKGYDYDTAKRAIERLTENEDFND